MAQLIQSFFKGSDKSTLVSLGIGYFLVILGSIVFLAPLLFYGNSLESWGVIIGLAGYLLVGMTRRKNEVRDFFNNNPDKIFYFQQCGYSYLSYIWGKKQYNFNKDYWMVQSEKENHIIKIPQGLLFSGKPCGAATGESILSALGESYSSCTFQPSTKYQFLTNRELKKDPDFIRAKTEKMIFDRLRKI